jgi:hypothetical protein
LKGIRLLDDWACRQFYICMSATERSALRPAVAAFVDHWLAA